MWNESRWGKLSASNRRCSVVVFAVTKSVLFIIHELHGCQQKCNVTKRWCLLNRIEYILVMQRVAVPCCTALSDITARVYIFNGVTALIRTVSARCRLQLYCDNLAVATRSPRSPACGLAAHVGAKLIANLATSTIHSGFRDSAVMCPTVGSGPAPHPSYPSAETDRPTDWLTDWLVGGEANVFRLSTQHALARPSRTLTAVCQLCSLLYASMMPSAVCLSLGGGVNEQRDTWLTKKLNFFAAVNELIHKSGNKRQSYDLLANDSSSSIHHIHTLNNIIQL